MEKEVKNGEMRKTISKTKKEVDTMKKTLLVLSLILFSVVLIYGSADAVTGKCSNCHTMHNSQDGSPMAFDEDGNEQVAPNERLLIADCIPCHSDPTGSLQKNSNTDAPVVWHVGSTPTATGAGFTNAGGDFNWVVGDDTKGHNVVGIKGEDANLNNVPPGFDAAATAAYTIDGDVIQVGSDWAGNQLTCAGTYGCHGTRASADQLVAVTGAHHANTDGTATRADDEDTVGDSFRFLAGIDGLEDANWNWNDDQATQHNEYSATDTPDGRAYDGTAGYSQPRTISQLCGECHGEFHALVANDADYVYGEPWRRHPTDIALPASGEYTGYTAYSIQAPIGRIGATPASAVDTASAGRPWHPLSASAGAWPRPFLSGSRSPR